MLVTPLNDLMNWVTNQGFAIAVASYLLLRVDQKLDKLIKLLEKSLSN